MQSNAAQLLESAHKAVAKEFGPDDDLARVALHLIECATGVVDGLPDADLDSAQEALGAARAAVLTATYAVRRIHDHARREQP
ncbi:hypothetical protein [Streptomyces eurocidicus]|uniref:Uncharacterized protein n=1 Tax=Streptomyces eurocidicus TaxID=66423 RepID=A0A7W8BFM5_STREU|nr:hypothetical protein [Streptomyces eurocidicus]MBB5120584.1 hypothetical protein [Streptomyces eurocidicus]